MSLKSLFVKSILQNTNLSFQSETEETVSTDIEQLFISLINGHYFQVLNNPVLAQNVFLDQEIIQLTETYINSENIKFLDYITQFVSLIELKLNNLDCTTSIKKTYLYIVGVLFLQMFVTLNFSGPTLPFEETDNELGFLQMLHSKSNLEFKQRLQKEVLDVLNINGFSPYHLVQSPSLLAFSLIIFEKLQGSELSLMDSSITTLSSDQIVERSFNPQIFKTDDPENYLIGSICWYRARALQVQQAILPEISPDLTSLSLSLLSNKAVNALVNTVHVNSEINQTLLITFYLECANISLAGDLELQTLESIVSANNISGLSLVLTGCKAKLTQYQQKSTATLTVLAKSSDTLLRAEQIEKTFNPLDVKLNDDLFLERPQYDSIGDNEILAAAEEEENDDSIVKRIKIDFSGVSGFESSPNTIAKQLLPIAMNESDIPENLSTLNPNNQPNLANIDHVQLLLRMQAILNNTPAGNTLVNEELIAVIQRTLFSEVNSVNWLIFARALWYRSLLETARSRTVERGVLQLYSLVEELGVTSDQTARLFPKTDDEIQFPVEFRTNAALDKPLANAIRLRYLYQLPLMPKWSMDSKLAEKLMELGSLKSALEIYERLEKWTDAALCYATTGDEARGIELVNKALEINPNDARSWSVLGDITGNPELWEKAWSIGRYSNAKRSLSKYYYSPPKSSGLTKDIPTAIDHMFDCLSANPIDYQNWFFYGCMGLEIGNHELAAEAFTRCVALDDTNSYAWSNLASALIKLDKLPEAFNALQKSVNSGDSAKKSWKIWENYMIVAVKLGKWDEVLYSSIVLLNRKKELDQSEASIDLPIVEKLVDLLVAEPYDERKSQRYFQKTCIDFVCNMIPSVLHHDSRIWRIIAKVDLWRQKPWLALEDYEKAYRAVSNNPSLSTEEPIWNLAVESCEELVSAYENFGSLEGRHGAGDVICKDWKFKAKSCIRTLISKGKASWEYTDSYERLEELKKEVMSL